VELTRLKRQRASDEVYLALREGVLTQVFRPGERLNVDDIAEKLGVSLTPVRHAIQQLAVEGLIEIQPRSGTYVARLSARDVEETCEIRCALECQAAEAALARFSEADLALFDDLLRRMDRPVTRQRERTEHELDNLRFHRLIVERSENRRLAEMYESLNAHLQIARLHRHSDDWAARTATESAEHREIVEAIRAGDSERLRLSLRRHILRGGKSLTAGLPE